MNWLLLLRKLLNSKYRKVTFYHTSHNYNKMKLTFAGHKLIDAFPKDIFDKQEQDFHQAILDIGYDKWQKHDKELVYSLKGDNDKVLREGTREEIERWMEEQDIDPTGMELDLNSPDTQKPWGYTDMLDWMKKEYGTFVVLFVRLGRMNQQVNNGGFSQYYTNGYASSQYHGCFWNYEGEIEGHTEMLELFKLLLKKQPTNNIHLAQKAITLFAAFVVDIDKDQYTEEDDYDEETNEYLGTIQCNNDEFGTIMNTDQLEEWNIEFFNMSEEWMIQLNNHLGNFFHHIHKGPEQIGDDKWWVTSLPQKPKEFV